jgi:8-oxo-dGTP pyrophosphatase MutT (NUDIX family)
MHYVLGFQFDEPHHNVALICKTFPKWQAGLWNGIGGHIERGESAQEAMLREFVEETGVSQEGIIWRHFADLVVQSHHLVSCFSSFTNLVYVIPRRSPPHEEVTRIPLERLASLRDKLVTHVPWLIEMALTMRNGSLTVSENPPFDSQSQDTTGEA